MLRNFCYSVQCVLDKSGLREEGEGQGVDRDGDRGWTNSGHNWELLWPVECRETNPTVPARLCSAEACFAP